MKTSKQFKLDNPQLNEAQHAAAYMLTQVDGWKLDGLTLSKDGKVIYLHPNGNALEHQCAK